MKNNRSLLDIIENKQVSIYTVLQAGDYKWEQLYGESHIREWLNGAHSNPHAKNIKIEHTYSFNPCGGYCSKLQDIQEAVILDDGRILVCVSTSEFGGTFSSHDNIEVGYYGLTPLFALSEKERNIEIEKHKQR